MSLDFYVAVEEYAEGTWRPARGLGDDAYRTAYRADLTWIHRSDRAAWSLFVDGPLRTAEGRRRASLGLAPVDQRFGAAAHLRSVSPPERLVPVTWVATIADVLGPERTAAFRRLEALSAGAELRCIWYLA